MGFEAGPGPLGLPGVEEAMGWGWVLLCFSVCKPGALWSKVQMEGGLGRPDMNVASAHTSCVSLGKLLYLPEPQCFYLLTGGQKSRLTGLL